MVLQGREAIPEPVHRDRRTYCSLCRCTINSVNMMDYYEHMFYIHVEPPKRELIKATVKQKAATITLYRCPEKGCGRQLTSVDQLARHFGALHCSLQARDQ
jgi:hypothetical protein